MPRAFASGQIAFGLVSIPVKLFSATEASEKISFNMIHRDCGSRIQQQLFCPKDERTYALLSKALEQTGRWALAKYAARGKQYLVILRPLGKGIVMQQLFYPNEIRSMDELDLGEPIVKDNELKMAVQLAEMGATDEFHPEAYRDEVAERTRALIQRKIEGEEITSLEDEQPRAQVIDLMEALKASLAGAPRGRSSSSGSKSSGGGKTVSIKSGEKRKAPKAVASKPAGRASKAR